MLVEYASWTLFFILFHAFSMGFKSEEFLGHSNTDTWLSFSHFLQSWTCGQDHRPAWSDCIDEYPKMVVCDDQEPLNSCPLSW